MDTFCLFYSLNDHFLFSDYYMKNSAPIMTSSSLVSPLLQTNGDLQCVELNYKFTGHSMAHFTLTLYRNNQSESTKINLHSTDEWITYKYQSKKAFKFIVLSIEPFDVNYGRTELASVDNITVTQGNCKPIGKLFSSLKPLGQMNRNLVGSICGRSSIKIAYFIPIHYQAWPP